MYLQDMKTHSHACEEMPREAVQVQAKPAELFVRLSGAATAGPTIFKHQPKQPDFLNLPTTEQNRSSAIAQAYLQSSTRLPKLWGFGVHHALGSMLSPHIPENAASAFPLIKQPPGCVEYKTNQI